jgi:hypothetical protein
MALTFASPKISQAAGQVDSPASFSVVTGVTTTTTIRPNISILPNTTGLWFEQAGTFTVDGTTSTVAWPTASRTGSNASPWVLLSGATLNLGGANASTPAGSAKLISFAADATTPTPGAGLVVPAGATINWFGGVIEMGRGAHNFTGTCTFKDSIFMNVAATSSHSSQVRFSGTPVISGNIVLDGAIAPTSFFIASTVDMSNLQLDLRNSYLQPVNATTSPLTLKNISIAANRCAFDLLFIGGNANLIQPIIWVNNDKGTGCNYSQSSLGQKHGLHVIDQELIFDVKDTSLASIPSASIWIKTESATRSASNPFTLAQQSNIDLTDPGMANRFFTPSGGVLRMGYAYSNVFGTIGRVTFSETDTPGVDDYTARFYSYGHALASQPVVLKSSQELTISQVLIGDAGVTLSESAAGALTSIATLDNLYDAAKHWKTRQIVDNVSYPDPMVQPVAANGSALELGDRNLIIDGAAASAFAINTATNTITINSTALAAGSKFTYLETTGTVYVVNGGGITVNYSDAAGAKVSLSRDGGGLFSGMVRRNGVDGAPYHNVTSIPLTLFASDTVRIYMIAYGCTGRIINTTGEALIQNAMFALDADPHIDLSVSATRRNEVAAALDYVTDGLGNVGAAVNADLVTYTPGEALAGFHWWLVSEGTIGFTATLAANTPDLFTTDVGAIVLGSSSLYVQANDSFTSANIPASGVYVPIVVKSSVAGYNPLRKNANGVVLGTALWSQDTASMAVADRLAVAQQTASDVWSAAARTLTASSDPTAAQVASAVRSELATELGRLDVAVGSRLAESSYTAPANADISAIKAKTDALPAQPAAVGSAMTLTVAYDAAKTALPASSYMAPDNASIADIKAKTDQIQIGAGGIEADVKYVNGVEVKGSGLESDPWGPV